MKIDILANWPLSSSGTRELLPKQQEFYNKVIYDNKAKYVAYVGGIGSGKTKIGVLAILTMAVLKAGDYLICRQFSPELKVTTYKEFMDLCPSDLIVEHRVADMQVKIKAVNGTSNIFFRPLEDPDKFRSMNLNAFLIDEGNQVTEEAFILLQGRLRGSDYRKGLIVSNPSGHDFIWRWFVDKMHIKTETVRNLFHIIRAPSTENIHLPEGYLDTLMNSWSHDRIEREIMGSMDAFEGAVYEEFRREIHVIKPFKVPTAWPRYIGIDHGLRNPSAWIWGAVGPDGEVYIYREFYEKEWLIEEIIKGKKVYGNYFKGVMDMMMVEGKYEKITQAVIDPSTRRRDGKTGESDFDEYLRHLPKDFGLTPANNDVELGINRVKSYLKVNDRTKKPSLYIFDTCTNLLDEITQYRYPELRPSQEGRKNQHEKPVKVKDHALDALRYLTMLMPEPYKATAEDYLTKVKYNSIERMLFQEIQALKKPRVKKDAWGD